MCVIQVCSYKPKQLALVNQASFDLILCDLDVIQKYVSLSLSDEKGSLLRRKLFGLGYS